MPATIRIGTSGWHYPHWKQRFYPGDLPATGWLPYYARYLRCVEINNTFYHLPQENTIEKWRNLTPADFVFAVKAPQTITHRRKLKQCTPLVEEFLERLSPLEDKLEIILFQLPPRWHCNTARLGTFLRNLPPGRRYAFEFRDPTWHDEAVYALLREANAAFCLYELGDLTTPLIMTADFVYVRLHGPAGPYAGSYTPTALRRWAQHLRRWQGEGKDCWLFFDNDQNAYAVKNALALQGELGLNLPSGA
ncbi:MAG TPA: DUF72 domain-containing protein [Gammaproteobacteria bacterium]|nr:DUF72 domain-containing protein [Gammaproteobacteria bacterium]